ncbi:LADA_0H04236g1_1 [Lachancea dasiensis]|uniref:LADA_0H04236g1_1 n=1 Tax=Lachancea dasiensis TaxID=1072105 RepID=A0A1G4K0P4_9SACH|nr:LADA_0H04236g1_1 [Lachancea dasiensis]
MAIRYLMPENNKLSSWGSAKKPHRIEELKKNNTDTNCTTMHIKLSGSKTSGTVLKHKSVAPPAIEYNAFNRVENPSRKVHESKRLHISLDVDADTFCLQALTSEIIGEATSAQRPALGAVTGTLHVTVKGTEPLLLNYVQVRLSGYTCEYARRTGTCADGDRIQIVNTPNSNKSVSYNTPFIQDIVHFNSAMEGESVGPDRSMLLPPGIYNYKFEFLINSEIFPASIASHLGSTVYRLEALVTVPRTKHKFETVVLTSIVTLKKALSPEYTNALEDSTVHNTWREGLLDYSLSLSSRVLEIDTPLQLSLQLVRKLGCEIKDVQVALVQTTSIPCLDASSGLTLDNYYCQPRKSLLRQVGGFDPKEMCYNLSIDDLVVPSSLKSSAFDSIIPSYEERNSCLPGAGPTRYRLKISHEMKALITLSVGNTETVNLSLKIPVLLLDRNLGISAQLPKYEVSPVELNYCNSASSVLSPPKYDERCGVDGIDNGNV